MAVIEVQIRNRWSATPLPSNLWTASMRRAQVDFGLRHFAVAVWRRSGKTFVTVGERMRSGATPECAPDGTEFAAVWLDAATEGEVQAFWLGILAGEAVSKRP